MADKYEQVRREAFECGLSLAAAIQDAGGSVGSVLKNLRTMKLIDFIATVAAQNGIRFIYRGMIDQQEEVEQESDDSYMKKGDL